MKHVYLWSTVIGAMLGGSWAIDAGNETRSHDGGIEFIKQIMTVIVWLAVPVGAICGAALAALLHFMIWDANPFAEPTISTASVTPTPSAEGDATGGMIPYKNPHALLAYYLGIVSGLPLIGLPFGIAAFVLGLKGLRARKENPVIKGSVHAAIGIGCGGLFSLLWTVLGLVGLAAWLSS
ncbi:MAG: hypothetical protein VX346_12895 [Planctomycetota bacterium]|nr:hypothetical protein [Planctomycetota bacterium]